MKGGAGEEIRTLDSHLGKVVLYQLSYARAKESQNIHAGIPRVNRKEIKNREFRNVSWRSSAEDDSESLSGRNPVDASPN